MNTLKSRIRKIEAVRNGALPEFEIGGVILREGMVPELLAAIDGKTRGLPHKRGETDQRADR